VNDSSASLMKANALPHNRANTKYDGNHLPGGCCVTAYQ
jgi:hypothetical protein